MLPVTDERRARLEGMAAELLSGFPETAAFRVFDGEGQAVYGAGAGDNGLSVAERNWFKALKNNPNAGPTFSNAIVGRYVERPVMIIAIAVKDRQGRFLGAVGAAMDLGRLRQEIDALNIGAMGLVSIRRTDSGQLLLRRPDISLENNEAVKDQLTTRIKAGEMSGNAEFISQLDGISRNYAFRVLKDSPFNIVVAIARSDYLVAWAWETVILAVIAVVLLSTLVALIWRLHDREQRLRILAANAPDVIWRFRPTGTIIDVSGDHERILGSAAEDLRGHRISEFVHADDLKLLADFNECLSAHQSVSVRTRHKNGHFLWLESNGQVRREGGCIIETIAVSRDITQRVEQEKGLRLAAAVFANTQEGITITDADGTILAVNPAVTSITGYSPEELVGQNPRVLKSGRHDAAFYQRMFSAIACHGYWEGEIWNRRKSGDTYPEWLTISTVRDAGGNVVNYLGAFADISRIKASESRLEHLAHHDPLTALPNRLLLLSRLQHAAGLAQSLIDELREPFALSGGREVYVGTSVGISIFPDDGDVADQIIGNADAAMYLAKNAGRGTFRFYTEELTCAAKARVELELALRQGVDRDEFVLHYQPLIDNRSRCTIGVEALVRWNHPTEGLVAPGRFISLAEETGLIIPLGAWVLRTACRQMKLWLDAGTMLKTVAVNISPHQFKSGNLEATVSAVLEETGLPPQCLELEITESALMEHGDEAVAKLHALKALGVRLAIDDFGTGYSSLAYLKRFPIDKLKVDQTFVRGIPHDVADMEITSAVVALANNLDFEVLAEGVETEEQLACLISLGCPASQGYLFSHPLTVVEFECFNAEYT